MGQADEGRDVHDQCLDRQDEGVLRRVFEIASSVARGRFRLSACDAEEIAQEMMLRAFHRLNEASINVAWVSRGAKFL
jgi:DNA-directed RNA polymerase specialized sigma24 family protein